VPLTGDGLETLRAGKRDFLGFTCVSGVNALPELIARIIALLPGRLEAHLRAVLPAPPFAASRVYFEVKPTPTEELICFGPRFGRANSSVC
jgi:hypothetical protein